MAADPSNRYELATCAFRDHVLVGTDVATLVPGDAPLVREHGALRWHRCLRCDSWLPRHRPVQPSRERMPDRHEIEMPLRGRALRDRYVLRLIALDRAVHVTVLTGLAVAVFFFIGHRNTLRRDYVDVMNALTGSSGGPNDLGGLLGHVRHLFVITPTHLYEIGLVLVAYAVLEGVEMVGLWLAKRWAEYLTFVATVALVPLEVYELSDSPSPLKVVLLVINLAIAIYLLLAKRLFGLRGGHAAEVARREAESGWAAVDRRTVFDG